MLVTPYKLLKLKKSYYLSIYYIEINRYAIKMFRNQIESKYFQWNIKKSI
jgi:hypothetical protein